MKHWGNINTQTLSLTSLSFYTSVKTHLTLSVALHFFFLQLALNHKRNYMGLMSFYNEIQVEVKGSCCCLDSAWGLFSYRLPCWPFIGTKGWNRFRSHLFSTVVFFISQESVYRSATSRNTNLKSDILRLQPSEFKLSSWEICNIEYLLN